MKGLGKQYLSLQTNLSYDSMDVENFYITDSTSISNFLKTIFNFKIKFR